MRKAILSTFVALLPVIGLAFPYATNPATRLRVADISSSYTNFTWQIDGGSDLLITNVWWDAAVTGVYLRFAWQDEVHLDVTNGTVVNGTSFWALVTHTNLPGNGPYKLEFLGWENNYTSVPRRVLGKGQANIQNSIWQSTNNASWVNPQAGMVIGPPIHTITDPSNWPFATSAQITNVSNGGVASTGEVTIVDGDVVITFPRYDDGPDRVLVSDGTATNITLVGDVKADNEAVYAAAFSASTNGQQSDVVYLSMTDYAFNGGLGGGIFRALYNRWAGIVDYDFSLAFGIHSNSERRITLPYDNVIATFGVNNGGPSLSNTIAFDAPLSMGGHRITNLAAAVDQLDAVPYYQAQNLGAQQALAITNELLSGTNTWTGSNTFNNGILSPLVRATTSGGMQIQSLNGSTCAVFGAGSDCNVSFGDGATFAGTITAPTHSLGVGTFTGSVYSTVDHTSMAPASNELVTADWVRGLSMSGQEWFFTTNVVTEPPAVIAKTTNVVSLAADVPAAVFSNSIASPTNLQYLAAGVTTNTYTGLRSPVTFEVYANISGGNPASVISVHPELYYYYVGGGTTNLLGDWETANQSVTATMTTPTRFLFTVAFPEPTITGSVALVGFLKCGGVAGAAATLHIVGGGVYPSHMDIESAASGDSTYSADLASGLLVTNAYQGGVEVPKTNGTFYLSAGGGASLVFHVNGFTQAVTLANSDTGAAPREVYAIDLKAAGVVERDLAGGWDTGKLAFVVGPALAGKNLQVDFQTVFQGAGSRPVNGYAMRRKVTFPIVPGALTNFPVLVKFAAGEYGRFQSALGADLRFVDAAGTELAYEIETWNPAGESFVWVRVPTLTNGAAVWAYWGKPGDSAPIYTANGATWTNFNLVAHLGQSNLVDSSALRNNADRNGAHTNAAGVVGGGRGFLRGDGIGWQPNFPAAVGANMGGGFTVEAWVNKINSGGTDGLLGMYHSGSWPYADSFRLNTDGSDVPYIALRRSGSDSEMTAAAGGAFPLNQWVHLVGVFDGSYLTFYTNGVQAGKSGYSAGAVNLSAESWFLGSYGDAKGYQNIRFTGIMDEVRLSSVARGSNWVWATYRTVASNATWQTYGAIEAADGDWPGIFVNDQAVSAGRPFAAAEVEFGHLSAWVLAPTNGTRISFGARLKENGSAMVFGGAGTGVAQRVTIMAY